MQKPALAMIPMLLALSCQPEAKQAPSPAPHIGSEPVDLIKELGPEFFAQGNAWYHAAQTFYRLTGRWPTNIVELSSVGKPSDPLFAPSHYQEVEFTVRPDGDLEMKYQSKDNRKGVVVVDPPQTPGVTK